MSKEKIKQIQDIIKDGCASGRPYPWCGEDVDCKTKACWYDEAKDIHRLVTPSPGMLDVCHCGHLFEEHDWGAFYLAEAGCLVEDCDCENFV